MEKLAWLALLIKNLQSIYCQLKALVYSLKFTDKLLTAKHSNSLLASESLIIMSSTDFTEKLQNLMLLVGIDSFKALGKTSGVSERQILRIRRGELHQMRVEVLWALAQVLQISLNELIATFSTLNIPDSRTISQTKNSNNQQFANENTNTQSLELESLQQEIATLKQEYLRVQQQLKEQKYSLLQEFQLSSLQSLESLLLQFPSAAQKARENPKLAAVNLLPLVQKPLEKLLSGWGIETIAAVGAEIPYNPQEHQLLEGKVEPGDTVKVRYIGYRQAEKLLYRAKVIPL